MSLVPCPDIGVGCWGKDWCEFQDINSHAAGIGIYIIDIQYI